jgi:hypothetical protein
MAQAEFFLHVGPGCVATFACDLRPSIQDSVEDLQTEVRHTDLVGIGKSQYKTEETGGILFPDGIQLTARVTAGLFDRKKKLACIESAHITHFQMARPFPSSRILRGGVISFSFVTVAAARVAGVDAPIIFGTGAQPVLMFSNFLDSAVGVV